MQAKDIYTLLPTASMYNVFRYHRLWVSKAFNNRARYLAVVVHKHVANRAKLANQFIKGILKAVI